MPLIHSTILYALYGAEWLLWRLKCAVKHIATWKIVVLVENLYHPTSTNAGFSAGSGGVGEGGGASITRWVDLAQDGKRIVGTAMRKSYSPPE